ncbi:hypothetical protein KI387_009796, partial [Taxus chinensis]
LSKRHSMESSLQSPPGPAVYKLIQNNTSFHRTGIQYRLRLSVLLIKFDLSTTFKVLFSLIKNAIEESNIAQCSTDQITLIDSIAQVLSCRNRNDKMNWNKTTKEVSSQERQGQNRNPL